jgi:hypothetical protein
MPLVFLIQGYRLRWFLAPAPWQLRGFHGLRSVTIGSFYNAVLPGKLGELVKIHHFSRKNRIPLRTSLAAWGGEKFVDGCLTGLVAIALLSLPQFKTGTVGMVMLIPIGLAVVSMLMVGLAKRYPIAVRKRIAFLPSSRLRNLSFGAFVEFQYRLLHHQSRFRLAAFAIGFVGMNIINYLAFVLALQAANVPQELISPANILALLVVMGVIYFLPSALSAVGVMHYGVFTTMAVLANAQGVEIGAAEKDSFVLAGILFHAMFVIPELTLGSVHLWMDRHQVLSSADSRA